MVGPSRFKLPNGCLAAPSQGFYWRSTSFRASSLGCSRSAVQSPCGRWRIKKQSPRSVLAVTGRFELPNGCLAAPSPASTGAPLRFAHLPWGTRDRQFNHIGCTDESKSSLREVYWSGRADLNCRTAAWQLPRRASTGAPLRFAHLPWGTRDRQFNHLGCAGESKSTPREVYWSGRADLNCRPLAPQASALPS